MTQDPRHAGSTGNLKRSFASGAALALLLSLGCATQPQVGRYFGPPGKLGTPALTIRADGTLTERTGLLARTGTWEPVSVTVVKAEVTGNLQKRPMTVYYAIDHATGSFRFAYKLAVLAAGQQGAAP